MANIFSRLTKALSANLNDMIDRIEDPERMIRQTMREMEAAIVSAKEAAAESTAHEKQIATEIEAYRDRIAAIQPEIEQAVLNGDGPLARRRLAEKKEYERMILNFEDTLGEARRATEDMKAQLTSLEQELVELRVKRSGLMARQRAAEAKEHIAMTSAFLRQGLEEQDDFSRLADRISDIEERTEVMELQKGLLADDDSEEQRLAADSEIEAELAELRRRLLKPS